ncbi:hypothetical protein MVEN_02147700 [Mycena venus]|uniref:Uncharacterized protein n=1 Tax=Mycena venus TaxID=2733690 RepID=A0A8H6XAJ5_9AGAR|nr:hypothetical protein MVEN_02147700 [Mycena venus]
MAAGLLFESDTHKALVSLARRLEDDNRCTGGPPPMPKPSQHTLCLTSDRNTVNDDPESQPPLLILGRLTDSTIDNCEHSQSNTVSFFRAPRVPVLQRRAEILRQLPFISPFCVIHTPDSLSIDMRGLTQGVFQHCFA